MSSSLKYPLITLLLGAALLLLITAPGCQCKKDNSVNPPQPPASPKDIYLVTAIRVNNVPKDSLVYNDQQQVTERWDYNTTYRIWQNYVAYTYQPDGYVAIAKYYNENDNTIKSLSRKDSLVWKPAQLIAYTTYYRELGEKIDGYDTVSMQLTGNRQLMLTGSKDTIRGLTPGTGFLIYKEFLFQDTDIRQFTSMEYVNVFGTPSLVMEKFDLSYNSLINPLYEAVAKNPCLLRTITGDNSPFPSNDYFPYLGSGHLVTNIRYESDKVPATSSSVTYKMQDTTNFPQTQTIAGLNKTISYRYRIIKAN